MRGCPDRNELELLIDESLTPEQTTKIAAHVDTCADCRSTLDQLAGNLVPVESKPLPDFLVALSKSSVDDLLVDEWKSTFRSGAKRSNVRDGDSSPLSEYTICELLGRGGMGIVLRGRDRRLNRDVAIKIMRPSLASKRQSRERFLREARAMATIDHPHVVPVYHVGEHDGSPFMVMKCLEGETLAERMERIGPLPETFLRKLAIHAIQGLAAAHDSGHLHRDIKPENIFLETPDDNIRLLDFGLTRPNDETRLTADGATMGTAAYMSPEQARGSSVDVRSDYFSLGAVLYEAASGKLPFPGETILEILSALANDPPIDLRKHNCKLSQEFSCLVMDLLHKNADRRPSTSVVLLERLESKPATESYRFSIGIAVGIMSAAILLGLAFRHMRDLRVFQRLSVGQGPSVSISSPQDIKEVPKAGPERADKEVQQKFLRWAVSVGGIIHSSNHHETIRKGIEIPDKLLHIHTLDFIDAAIRDEDLKRLGQLGRVHRIQVGSRESGISRLTDDSLLELAALDKLWIKELSIQHVNFRGSSLKHLGRMRWLHNLAIHGGDFSDENLQELESLTRLQQLSLRNCNLTGRGLRHFADTPLRVLQLEDSTLDNRAIMKLPNWPRLEELSLVARDSQFNDATLLSLNRFPNLKRLKLIGMEEITDSGLEVLSDFSNLQYLLLLEIPKLSDETLRRIASDLPNLKELVIRRAGPRFTEKGVRFLESASQLKKIDLGHQEFSQMALNRLRSALPNCVIP